MTSIKNYISSPEIYKTCDLGCAAALLSCDFELLHLDKSNPKKSLFVFKKCDGIDATVDAYFSDNLTIKARRFFDSIRALKNRLYGEGL